MINRRQLLQAMAAAPLVTAWQSGQASSDSRRLLLVEFKGGNDGLNTFPALEDPEYRALRPTIALPRAATRPLGQGRFIHHALARLLPVWEAGQLAIVDGVGSPKPDLSHFRAALQWETGEPDDPSAREGWLGKALLEANLPTSPQLSVHAASLGVNAKPLQAEGVRLLQVAASGMPPVAAPEAAARQLTSSSTAEKKLWSVVSDWARAGTEMDSVKLSPSPVDWPPNAIAEPFKQALRLMVRDPGLRLLKVTVNGFDTHTSQVSPGDIEQGRHHKLLRKFGAALDALVAGLKQQGLWENTIIATYSEFGRRPRENGSLGTDHGTANSLFLLGGPVLGGFHGELPELTDRDANGNLVVSVDFRDYYAALLDGVLTRSPRRSRLRLIG